ncbi:MAG: transcription antitermination factor NusB [Cyanobacteriota bacterium]|nr:transcription antitermination factor NusB [Cyanobacteriota bacterium]MDY6383631.1 transcription antitermination factor NusB [Cyanobacteriota bacterium]
MQARRASRELAFILLSQFDGKIPDCSKENMDDLIIKSIRVLISSSNEELKTSLGGLIDMKNRIEDFEAEHETNLKRPMGAENIAVPMIMSSEMKSKINTMIDVAEKAIAGLEIAEFTTLDSQQQVKDYAVKIIKTYKENSTKIDKIIKEHVQGWDFDRLVKMDKDILRIALSELLYIKETPMKVIVDEAVELAKKYSTDDSASFVNGILAKVIVDNGLK